MGSFKFYIPTIDVFNIFFHTDHANNGMNHNHANNGLNHIVYCPVGLKAFGHDCVAHATNIKYTFDEAKLQCSNNVNMSIYFPSSRNQNIAFRIGMKEKVRYYLNSNLKRQFFKIQCFRILTITSILFGLEC